MNVVDTSGWLEFFSGGENAHVFANPIRRSTELIIPTICIYEISKVVLRESDEDHLLQILAALQKGTIVELTPALASSAAKVSLKHKLPMADSIVYATARAHRAHVWTQDSDFKELPDVTYIAKDYYK